jgi:hypothetical protein
MKKYLLLLALLCSGHAAPSLAQSLCTSIESLPATISEPGNYCLIGNQTVSLTSGDALTINANNVVLDCVNFSITNTAASASGSSNGININGRNTVTVKNCRVLGGFAHGIRASQNNSLANANYYINILDNYVAGPYTTGIYANGSAIEIRDNRVYDVGGQTNGYAAGIRVAGSTVAGQPRFHLVRGNLVAGTWTKYTNAYGILLDNSVAAIVLENGVSGTTSTNPSYRSYGVRTLGGTYNRITDNHVVGGGRTNDYGIEADATTSCFDNYIRSEVATTGCNATLGNY